MTLNIVFKIFLFCLPWVGLFAQNIFRIEVPIEKWDIDPLDQIIVITPPQKVMKFSSSGELLSDFTQQSFGKISFIDTKDPFTTLVFYKNAQTLVFLDKSFYQIGEIQFNNLDFIEIQLITTGNNKSLWVFDIGFQKLFKLSRQGQIEIESAPLHLIFNRTPNFEKIWVNSLGVFLWDKNSGLSQFDLFGRYLKTIPLPEIIDIHASSNFFYFQNSKGLWKIHFSEGDYSPIPIKSELESKESIIKLGNKYIFIASGNEIKALNYEN
ncbi:MAG: hypothetical protein RJA52_433 [Bacteroidota bacterium]